MYVELRERIKALRKALKLTQKEFAEKLGKGWTTIQGWELGKTNPPSVVLSHIAKTFNVNPDWLLKGEGSMFNSNAKLVDTIDVPVVAKVGAGYPVEQGDVEIRRYITIKADESLPKKIFAVEVQGASMEPTLYEDDVVIAKPFFGNPFEIPNGKIIIVKNQYGELLIKRLKKLSDDALVFASDNPSYEPIIPNSEHAVVGIALNVVKVVKL